MLALSALRLMDYETERDHKFVVLLGLLLVAAKSLFSLDLYWIVPTFFAFSGLWYSLLPASMRLRSKFLLKIFIYSIPGAVLMFFVFPRVVVPWAMSRGGASTGEVGFADDMNPGKVAELAESPNVAFRAQIVESSLKQTSELYWRGSVLNISHGLSWKPGRRALRIREKSDVSEDLKNFFSYQVALEPSAQTFLFVLDGTQRVQMDNNTVLAFEQSVFRALRPISKTTAYRAIWDASETTNSLATDEDLKIPPLKGKVFEWVEKVKNRQLSVQNRLKEVQNLFSKGDFIYTLKPGTYGENGLEELLFKRKKGFCEHFAGSYATLVRALGIPARVVLGYQGGRYNPLGDFWKVSQKDAHAWAEVFIDGVWQRVDPTGWVAPLRLTIGAEEFFSLSEEDQVAFAKNINWRNSGDDFSLWKAFTHWAEDLNYQWTYFLIEFDSNSQESFWQKIANNKNNTIGFIVIVVGALVLVNIRKFRHKERLPDEFVLIRAVDGWGSKQGFPRDPSEPPLQYMMRLKEKFPYLENILNEISRYYDLKVYAQVKHTDYSGKELMKRWSGEVKGSKPRSA